MNIAIRPWVFLKKILLFLFFLFPLAPGLLPQAFAYNFLYINPTTGAPIGWEPGTTIEYYVDPGSLGRLTNEQARTLIQAAMDIWTNASPDYANVPHFHYAGLLPEDVNGTNYSSYVNISKCYNDSLSSCPTQAQRDLKTVIIFDDDGSILDNELCRISSCASSAGASVFAGSSSNPGNILAAYVVIGPYFGESSTKVVSVVGNMTHELGHLLGLAHTSINQDVYINHLTGYDRYMPTMFFTPIGIFLGHDDYTSDSLNPDDIAGITTLYPTTSAATHFGNIEGQIFKSDGSAMMHVNVVARNTADPLCESYSFLSGRICPTGTHGFSLSQGTCFDNEDDVTVVSVSNFSIQQLPTASYTVETEEVASRNLAMTLAPGIDGAYLFGDAEFWNTDDATNEANTLQTSITVASTETRSNINITLNRSSVSDDRIKYFPVSTFIPGPGTRCPDTPTINYASLIGVSESLDTGSGGTGEASGGSGGASIPPSSGCSLFSN